MGSQRKWTVTTRVMKSGIFSRLGSIWDHPGRERARTFSHQCAAEVSTLEERHGSGRGEVVLQLYKQRLERQVLVFFLATNERFFMMKL